MTLEELKAWMDDADCVDGETRPYGYDNEGSKGVKVCQKGRKFFIVRFTDGQPDEKWVRGKGRIAGEYELEPVKRCVGRAGVVSWQRYSFG